MVGIEKGEPMTIETDNEVSITIEFDEAIKVVAWRRLPEPYWGEGGE